MTTEPAMTGASADTRVCRVVVLHETDDALRRVTALCDHLSRRRWLEVDLQFEHWPFAALQDAGAGVQATRAAVEAQIVVVSAAAEPAFPDAFVDWAERWVSCRCGHEGALVGVLTPDEGGCATGCARDIVLHRLALRAGMDYLNHLPGTPKAAIPDVEDWCAARASAVTDTLSEILRSEHGVRAD